MSSSVKAFEAGGPHTATVSTSDGHLQATGQLLQQTLAVGESAPVMRGLQQLFTVTGVAAGILCEKKPFLFAIAHSGKTIQFQVDTTWIMVHSS